MGGVISRMRVKLQGGRGMLLYKGFVTHLAEMILPTVSDLAYQYQYTPSLLLLDVWSFE